MVGSGPRSIPRVPRLRRQGSGPLQGRKPLGNRHRSWPTGDEQPIRMNLTRFIVRERSRERRLSREQDRGLCTVVAWHVLLLGRGHCTVACYLLPLRGSAGIEGPEVADNPMNLGGSRQPSRWAEGLPANCADSPELARTTSSNVEDSAQWPGTFFLSSSAWHLLPVGQQQISRTLRSGLAPSSSFLPLLPPSSLSSSFLQWPGTFFLPSSCGWQTSRTLRSRLAPSSSAPSSSANVEDSAQSPGTFLFGNGTFLFGNGDRNAAQGPKAPPSV